MYRSKQRFLRNCGLVAVTVVAASLITSASLAAGSGRSQSAAAGKKAAPNLEDHANYFSDNRREVSVGDQKKADQLRLKTIASIEQLLKGKSKSIRRFELLLRLGELQVERHDFLRDVAMAQYERAWDGWQKGGKQGVEPKLSTDAADAEMMNAANSFRELVNEFPRHPRTDAALYSLARVLARMGRDTAVDYYQQLLQAFPKSPLVPDTYLSLGEFYFDKHQITDAMGYYKKVMDFKEHRAYPYAVYKLGWAYYNAPAKNDEETKENLRKAVTAFKLVVKLADRDRESGRARTNLDLREEALKDLVMVWADAEDVASAWKYFRSINEPGSFYKMLERLGNIYADQGKNDKAIAVFRRLLQDAPNRDNNPAIHVKLVELLDLTNNLNGVVAELKAMHQLYLGDTAFTRANPRGKDGAPSPAAEGRRLTELYTHRYGAIYHQRGQKAKSNEYLHHAGEIYHLYLTSFPTTHDAYEIRYYLAEILYDFKNWEKAAGHYLIVAKSKADGKYLRPSALNAVAAMNQAVQGVKGPALPPPGQAPKPVEVPRLKQKLVETIDQYVALLPKEKDGEPMRFTAAQILFEHGHYPDAIARFERITREIPQSKQAQAAVRVVLGFHAEHEDWSAVVNKGQGFLRNEALMTPELRKYVTDLLRASMFKRAIAYEKAGQNERAAASFVDFQRGFPKDPSADRALYNGMTNYVKASKTDQALATAKLLLTEYPKSSLVPDVLAHVGSTDEALAKFDEAAAAYRRLALEHPNDSRAPAALYNSAVLYKGLGQSDTAITLLREFGQRFPQHQIAGDAALELARLLEKQGALADAAQVYQVVARRYSSAREQKLFAAAKAASLKLAAGDRGRAMTEIGEVRAALVAKGAPAALEARAVTAEALFKLLEPTFADYKAQPINDGARLERQVADKQRKLESLAQAYTQVIDIQSPEFTVASLYRLGEAHENFASLLFKAPAPKGASGAEVDKLKHELEKVAFPLKEEAYKFFETAYRRSKEVDTFTTWTRRTYQKMVELAPQKHPEVDEISADPAYMSHEVKMTKPVAELMGAGE